MSLPDLILSALLSLPTFVEDRDAPDKRAQLVAVADAVASVATDQKITTPRNWAALILAIGQAESGFSLRIHAGQCKPFECDRGRARGLFQVHRYAEAVPLWEQMHGVENTAAQVQVAHARLKRGYYQCRGAADWTIATINGFAGKRCALVWPGLEARVALWRRAVRGMKA